MVYWDGVISGTVSLVAGDQCEIGFSLRRGPIGLVGMPFDVDARDRRSPVSPERAGRDSHRCVNRPRQVGKAANGGYPAK